MNKEAVKNKQDTEKALLVVIDFKSDKDQWRIEDSVEEMKELTIACGAKVEDVVICPVTKPTASHFITKGKLSDLSKLCGVKEYDTIIFSHDLKGSQQRNLEDVLHVKTIDRTQLILDIFARHARSKEGKMQVELAQLEYLLPRLVGKGVELSRLGGGIGTLGPGETKLEVDRRRISTRISKLKRDLKSVASNHALNRKKRKDKGIPTISLVGYTNAGKSTLLNSLTQAKQVTRDGLFTTLDSLSRQLILPNHQKIVVSDTVGFMHDLPHHLIEAFKTTLDEVKEADILLHVVDVSHHNFRDLHQAVLTVLEELEVVEKPIITVFNKMDQLNDVQWLGDLKESFDDSVYISALKQENIDELTDLISQKLSSLYREIHVDIPINRMDLVNLAHEEGEVFSVKYYNKRINIRATIPIRIVNQFFQTRT